jgi:hypothetical protein
MKKTILLSLGMLCMVALASAQPATNYDDAIQGTGNNQHNYVGAGWVHGSNTNNYYNMTLSYSNVAGAYVTFTFVGNRIDWVGEKFSTHGIAAVSIDGGTETLIDLYSSVKTSFTIYNSPNLTQGTHTFKIRVTGTKNPSSTGFYVVHDYVKTYQYQAPDNTNTFTGSGAMANITGPGVTLNAAYGYNALRYTTSASRNTAIGAEALVGIDRSNNNTAIGYHAMSSGQGHLGGDNTAVGAYALDNGNPGARNTAIGSNAGPVQGTFLINTTAIGAEAKTTADHQVRIGNPGTTSIGGQVSWSTLSDGRFKREIREDISGLDFVNKLRPVSYMIDRTAIQKFLGEPDSIANSKFANKQKPIRQTGFVAQEVDALVKKSGYVFSGVDVPKNDKDPYTIRYAEFVIPLVKAVQELSAKNDEREKQIAEQQKQIDLLLKQLGKIEEGGGTKSSEISLLQNNPNPFSVNTEIKMVLPETAGSANIIVYNLEGKQLKQLQVKGRGNVSTTILGNELNAGMYIYALIVDGKVVDTKRMILTK